jgi:hypothetical protein
MTTRKEVYTERLGPHPLTMFVPVYEGGVLIQLNYDVAQRLYDDDVDTRELGLLIKDALHAHFSHVE